MTDRELIRAAFAVRENAYAPYSHFKVGAALLTKSGRLFTGCNIENAAFSPTICAERAALAAAVSAGERSFAALAIAGGPESAADGTLTSPCGVCRQALYEFCGPDLRVILADGEAAYRAYTLGQLFPLGFGPANLGL